ncbi:MAG: Asp-tRNA(Asn)/Glu-tRNA(Gln) amidotransferase subunit GatC [Candidatus Acidiferrales bacterium]
MKLTRKDVEYVAALAHLELEPAELERMAQQLDAILEYIDQLNRLDTSNVEPMAQVLAPTASGPNPSVRNDVVQPCLPREQALAAAPDADGTFFKVPKVIER